MIGRMVAVAVVGSFVCAMIVLRVWLASIGA